MTQIGYRFAAILGLSCTLSPLSEGPRSSKIKAECVAIWSLGPTRITPIMIGVAVDAESGFREAPPCATSDSLGQLGRLGGRIWSLGPTRSTPIMIGVAVDAESGFREFGNEPFGPPGRLICAKTNQNVHKCKFLGKGCFHYEFTVSSL